MTSSLFFIRKSIGNKFALFTFFCFSQKRPYFSPEYQFPEPPASSLFDDVIYGTLLVDIVAVDGVDVVLHDSITRVFGDSGSDVAEIMDDTGLIVEKFVRDEAAAIRDVEMPIFNTEINQGFEDS